MFHAKHYFKKLQSHRLAIKYLWRIFKKIGVKKDAKISLSRKKFKVNKYVQIFRSYNNASDWAGKICSSRSKGSVEFRPVELGTQCKLV